MRILNFDEIKSVTLGASRFEEKNGALFFIRFTEEESALYETSGPNRGASTAGIKLSFTTDSKSISLKVNTEQVIARTYFAFDIFSNDKYCGSLKNFTDEEAAGAYTKMNFPLGIYEADFSLGEGTKKVNVYFPHSLEASILEIKLDDNAFIKPEKYEKRILCYGDSITQGYDELHPSKRYTSKLAEALSAEEINKAVGGEVFNPRLASCKVDFKPDLITVAYGTNDWTNTERGVFFERCRAFYKTVSENYPDSPIYAISPVWRDDYEKETCYGKFSDVAVAIKEAVKDLDNVRFLQGFDFIPHSCELFGDGFLHPNYKGFDFYFKALFDAINK